MLNKEGLEYLVNLGEENKPIVELNQGTYSKIQLNRVEKPRADYLQISTLTGLIDYIKSNIDKLDSELLIHIKAHDDVVLSSPLNGDRRRETYIRAEAILPNNIYYNQFLNTEQFNIMLQSSFISNKDRELLLKVTGCVKDEAIKQIGDDGVSQAATIKTGVASVNDVKIPNPVLLAPFRTFPEVKQPESKFIFRMQSGPRAALYEADGGAWRNEAIKNIKEYLEEQLKEVENIKIIA